jgi:hypothetical protein
MISSPLNAKWLLIEPNHHYQLLPDMKNALIDWFTKL